MRAENGLILYNPVELRYANSDSLLADISHSLHEQNRMLGRMPWTVAEHSLAVSLYLKYQNKDKKTQLAGMLHDAHEAFVGDMPFPVLRAVYMPQLDVLKQQIDAAIFQTLKLEYLLEPDSTDLWAAVEDADKLAFLAEWSHFIPWDHKHLTPDLLGYDTLYAASFGTKSPELQLMKRCVTEVENRRGYSWYHTVLRMLKEID
jgi:5'-deoxynucleotidase YfbR-like HD superfamily hydrolase